MTPSPPPDRTIQDLAKLLGRSESQVTRLVQQGHVHGYRITPASRWRIPAAEYQRLADLIAAGRSGRGSAKGAAP